MDCPISLHFYHYHHGEEDDYDIDHGENDYDENHYDENDVYVDFDTTK